MSLLTQKTKGELPGALGKKGVERPRRAKDLATQTRSQIRRLYAYRRRRRSNSGGKRFPGSGHYALPPLGRDDGVAARTRHRLRLRHDEGGRQEIIDPARIAALRTRPSDDPWILCHVFDQWF